jgi:NADH-quinone oxidoreductase subunit J
MTAVLATSGTATVSSGETFAFWVLATLTVAGALGMLFSRKAVHSALWIALTMVSLAVLYLINAAPFLSMVQVIVYTGAVMMLFLFVLMLVGVDASDSLVETIKGQRVAAIVVGIGFGVLLIAGISGLAINRIVGVTDTVNADGGNVQAIAHLIFGRYVLPFEVTSALLITAALGAMVYTHRERLVRKPTQRMLSEARFRSDGVPRTPLPPPGVYAGHNAVDTPALLPDGSPSLESVPTPFQVQDASRTFTTADGRTIAPVYPTDDVEGEDEVR